MKEITLADVVAQVESSDNPDAIRYEPIVHSRFKNITPGTDNYYILENIMKYNNCNLQTACVLASMSFGKYQIMGENLYGNMIDLKYGVIDYLSDEEDQEISFEVFVSKIGFYYGQIFYLMTDNDLLKFATRYNGPGNPEAYVKAMKNVYIKLSMEGEK